MAVFRSRLRHAISFHHKVAENALTAAAVVVVNRAKRNVRGGFKSGDFVTGNLMNKITHVVYPAGLGRGMRAEVGTNVDYGAYWELGHRNRFTRKYERKEWLRPAMKSTRSQQADAAERAARATARRFGGRIPDLD